MNWRKRIKDKHAKKIKKANAKSRQERKPRYISKADREAEKSPNENT
ncbi:DUF2986 domain-containing protein [Myxococcota bacterium]|nr:DUF2986 domain-containing protein [Myxococcota bacterium]